MKASCPVDAFQILKEPMSRLACFPLILLLVLGACSKPVSTGAAAASQGAGNPGASTVSYTHLIFQRFLCKDQ